MAEKQKRPPEKRLACKNPLLARKIKIESITQKQARMLRETNESNYDYEYLSRRTAEDMDQDTSTDNQEIETNVANRDDYENSCIVARATEDIEVSREETFLNATDIQNIIRDNNLADREEYSNTVATKDIEVNREEKYLKPTDIEMTVADVPAILNESNSLIENTDDEEQELNQSEIKIKRFLLESNLKVSDIEAKKYLQDSDLNSTTNIILFKSDILPPPKPHLKRRHSVSNESETGQEYQNRDSSEAPECTTAKQLKKCDSVTPDLSFASDEDIGISTFLEKNVGILPGSHTSAIASDIKVLPEKRHKTSCKSYIDFKSDEDFSGGSSELWNGTESASTDEENNINIKQKSRKNRKKNKERVKVVNTPIKERIKIKNKSAYRKNRKNAGDSYETRTGNYKEEKKIHENPCLAEKCQRKCYEIDEERRKSLFNFFWSLDLQRRRDWIAKCSKPTNIARKKTANESSRRNITYEYFINENEGFRKVCQKFLIKTLDITQKFILYTLANTYEGMAQKDLRHSNIQQKYSETCKSEAKVFIKSLPAVPSHYCRSQSKRVYLPQEYRNATNLYRIYAKYCDEKCREKLSEKLFISMFNNDFNISFHVPKKDKCVLCVKVENKELLTEKETEELKEHTEEKKATYKRFKIHQNLLSSDTITVSFDLQKVLNTPHGQSMLLYYSRKYAMYNLTFYESGTQNGICYVWGESDGKRGGNDIATCVYKYLQDIDKRGFKNVLLYCDSCTGQNKNKIVLAALYHFLQTSTNVQNVQINYLLPGHTYMPVDSMHSVIEREVRNLIVWGPSQWPTFIESARKKPRPYKVNVLEYSDFINWDQLVFKLFTTETNKQIQFRKLRVITLKKKNPKIFEIKCSMKEETEVVLVNLAAEKPKKGKQGKNLRKKGLKKPEECDTLTYDLKPAYQDRLPISIAKYKDLKKLCDNNTIPKRFHKEYLELPSLHNVADELLETDEDDVKDD